MRSSRQTGETDARDHTQLTPALAGSQDACMRFFRTLFSVWLLLAAFSLGSCVKSSEQATTHTYGMGDKATVGHVVFTVFETQWMTQFGHGPTARVPGHRFLLIRLSAFNGGGEEVMLPGFTLVDDKGEIFFELTNGEQAPNWMGYLRRLRPNESGQGNVLFDVSPGRYKLKVTDETEQRAAFIDLPLSFSGDAAAVPGGVEPALK
jgi:hypothetical protein